MRLLSHRAATLALMWITHFLMDGMIGFWSVYKTLAGLNVAKAGLIAGLSPFIGEGLQVFFGELGDRGFRKALLCFGLAASAAATLFPYTNSYFLFFLLFLATCIGSGAYHPTAVAVTGGLTERRKGLFITIFASGGALGLALSHILFTAVYQNLGGSTALLSLPPLLLAVALFFFTLPSPLSTKDAQKRRFGLLAMKELFGNRNLLILYISQVCNQAIYWGVIFLLPDILKTKGYDPWMSYGGGHFFLVVGGACTMIPGGHLSDRYSPKKVLLFASLFGILLFYAFLFAPPLQNTWMLALLFWLGACLGIANPVAVALGNRMVPTRPGLVSALLMGLVWCVSEAIGPSGAGLLTKFFAVDAPTKALACLGFLFVLGMIATILLPEEVEEENLIPEAR